MYRCDGIPLYVGKGQRKRAWVHLVRARASRGYHSQFQQHLSQLLRMGSVIIVEIVQDNLSQEEALALEIDTIQSFRRRSDGGTLWNRTRGGDLPESNLGRLFPNRRSPSQKGFPGKKWSDEDRARHSQRMTEYMSDPEVRRKVSVAKTGKPGQPHTEESRAKISAAQRRPSAAKSRSKTGSLNPMYGRRWFNNGERSSLFFPGTEPAGWKSGKR